MDDNQKNNIEFGIKIATGIITLGIVPLVNTLREIWEKGAPEREKRRLFRLERLKIKNSAKNAVK